MNLVRGQRARSLLMQGAVRPMMLRLARLIGQVVPSKEGLVVFHSRPDFSGNARALHRYLREHHPEIQSLWIVESPDSPRRLRQHGLETVTRGSLASLLALARAEIVVTTHTYPLLEALPRAIVVNLWHGLSLKGVGATQKNAPLKEVQYLASYAKRTTLAVASSELSRRLIAASRLTDPSKIEITGYPRNDWLFAAEARKNLERAVGMSLGNRQAILYAPTCRHGLDERSPATAMTTATVLHGLLSPEVSRALEVMNADLVVKLHPYDEGRPELTGMAMRPPLHLLTTQHLVNANLDLYEVLGGVDILVADYSSLAMDFLLLDRPIVFYTPDIDDFTKTRGMKLNPVDAWLPGPRATDMPQLISVLAEVAMGLDHHAELRARVADALYQHRDDRSCRRVWQAIDRIRGPHARARHYPSMGAVHPSIERRPPRERKQP